MAETLLVTGASGFLGAHVVAAALAAGRRVVATARNPEDMPRHGSAVGELARAVDLAVPGAATKLLEEVQPAVIISCAALSTVGACERDPGAAHAVNAAAPGALAEWCATRGARLVHVSSDLVFGRRPPVNRVRYRERDRPSPLHEYGLSKTAGEREVLTRCPWACVARLPLLFGDSAGRGRGAGDSLLAALARGERPVLFTDEHRTPLEVGSAALALLELAGMESPGLLHVAGIGRFSRYDLGLRLLAAAGIEDPAASVEAGKRADLGLEAQRPSDVSLDARHARGLLATALSGPP